jgi:hypothetical protein
MYNSKTKHPEIDDPCIARATERIRKMKVRLGTWRKVGEALGVNQKYPYQFFERGIVPRSKDIRKVLKIPPVLPSERKIKKVRVNWRAVPVELEERIK